ncbi:hypothetical protein L9F63_004453, partial [Diploptera punctata]
RQINSLNNGIMTDNCVAPAPSPGWFSSLTVLVCLFLCVLIRNMLTGHKVKTIIP